MSIYKEALRKKVKLTTPKGLLTIEQAWDLTVPQLEKSVREANKVLKENSSEGSDLDFLEEKITVNPVLQLEFDILKDMYLTKKAEQDAIRTARDNKEHNEKIMKLIAEQEDNELKGKSKEELRAMLK